MGESDDVPSREGGRSELWKRVMTALVGLPLLVAASYLGGIPLLILLVVAAVVGTFELAVMGERRGFHPIGPVAMGAAALYVLTGALPTFVRAAIVLGALGPLVVLLFRAGEFRDAVADWAWTVAAPLYVGWPLSYFVLLRAADDQVRGALPAGFVWVAATLAVTFTADSAAYFGGRALGHRRLAPRLSPGKTQEGTAIGLLAAAVVGTLVSGFLLIAVWQGALFGLVVGVAAVCGDLVESLLKRGTGVKDSGAIMPGHGGLLDRLDSLLFAGVAAYYLRAALI